MMKMLKVFLPLTLLTGLLFSQAAHSIEANWQLGAAIVEYTYVVRDSVSAEDATTKYAVTGSWPSSAAAAAGQGFTRSLVEYDIGDTITVALVPLVTPDLLAENGVAMNVDINNDGTFTINDSTTSPTGVGSTYPTTDTENCSTYATVPSVSESGTWIGTPGFTHQDDPNAYSMGWGISLSSVFAQFSAPDLVGGTNGVDYGVGTNMENWGMATIDYTDETHATPAALEIYWEAHDGVASGLGVDTTGALNGVTGVPVAPSDTVTISNMEAYLMHAHPDTSLWYNLGWTGDDEGSLIWPMLGGKGQKVDPDDTTSFHINPATQDTIAAGQVAANWGYIFDPLGSDGAPFNGDEPLAPTGYFFTRNFLQAASMFPAVMNAHLGAGVGLDTALAAAADSVAFIYLDAPTSAAIGAQVSSALYTEYTTCLGAGGGDACSGIFAKGPTASLMAVKTACDDSCGVDDSGWDWEPVDDTGRLVFEIDNNCIPDNTTQRVKTFWANTALMGDTSAVDTILSGYWKLAPVAGALGVGPSAGDYSWWSNTEGDVTTRACLFDDQYVFNADGSFQNMLGSEYNYAAETWLEPWQGVDPEACGAPVAPHDGTNAATWSVDEAAGTITVSGSGAYLGLAKVHNGGEDGAPVGDMITYNYSLSDDGNSMDVTISGFNAGVPGATWIFKMVRTESLKVDEEALLPQKFEVYGNYPNPFNPSTQIKFATEKSSDVTIKIYSILGQEIAVLQNGILNAGIYNISWFGKDRYGNKVPSGVYFYEVRSDNRTQKGKMLLLK